MTATSTSSRCATSRRSGWPAFKVPRYWQQLAELPHTPTGRVAKHQLPSGHPDGELGPGGALSRRPAAGQIAKNELRNRPASAGSPRTAPACVRL